MSDPTQPPLAADASQDEIEADIAATRARLAESVDALADKMDVKAQAKDKVADVKAQASDKVTEVKNTATAKVVGVKIAAQEKLAGIKASVQDKVGHSPSTTATTGIPPASVTVAGPARTVPSSTGPRSTGPSGTGPISTGPSRAAGPVPGGAKGRLVDTSQQVWTQVKALPLVGQVAAGAVPLLAAVLLIERRKKD